MNQDILEFIKSISSSEKEVFETYFDLIETLETIQYIQHDNIPEIIQATILKICDLAEVKDCYDEFKSSFNNNPKIYTLRMRNILDDYCNSENICRICGSYLDSSTYEEDHGEYNGFPCLEQITGDYCHFCGYIE
ncbi:MAG: hypothetical protein RR942_01455 [Romboutsia sp.]